MLEKAISVFWRKGYAETSIRDLTDATGLSAPSLYHRFKDKDGLFVQVLRQYAHQGLDERLTRLSAKEDPLSAIREFLGEMVVMTLSDAERRGCLLVNTVLDGAEMSNEARTIVQERLNEVEQFFAKRLEAALEKGQLRPEADIDAASAALIGTVFAIRVMGRLDTPLERFHALVEHVMVGLPTPTLMGRTQSSQSSHSSG
ncbi:TetR/AcrR family transcriptional regulator [Acidihalobacter yilgarnensis]|uniref:TetR/AcrR family transcriptional regulator n=1 Tax=Acidihalobacter yilgarnensis TaxID=2819280 RepID=UPI0018D478BC|nr:TetR/AcrR family transcriptional regulator [Acidihalobacter yilgarnensis]